MGVAVRFGTNCKHCKASEYCAQGLRTVRSTKWGERGPAANGFAISNSSLIPFTKNAVKIYRTAAKKKLLTDFIKFIFLPFQQQAV